MSAETVKNIKFGDKVIKTDTNGSAGDIEADNVTADNVTADNLYFYYGSQKYVITIGEYGIKAEPVS